MIMCSQLTGHRVSLGVDIDALGRSCGGDCGSDDLETALQMVCNVYQYMTTITTTSALS
jgi:hypothetical protein